MCTYRFGGIDRKLLQSGKENRSDKNIAQYGKWLIVIEKKHLVDSYS